MTTAASTLRAAHALLESAVELLKDSRDTLPQATHAESFAALSSLATHADACMWHLKQAIKKVEEAGR